MKASVETANQIKWNRPNLLNTSSIVGCHIETGSEYLSTEHCYRLLQKIDSALLLFPQLLKDKSFLDKLLILQGPSFLSTLSELSLASELVRAGYNVSFERKFHGTSFINNRTVKRDVDLSVSDSKGNNFEIEIYTPYSPLEQSENGFLDLFDENYGFQVKVNNKSESKFGIENISGLSGKKILAVNEAFSEKRKISHHLSSCLEGGIPALSIKVPNEIDGLLIFSDAFDSDNSFWFTELLFSEKGIEHNHEVY